MSARFIASLFLLFCLAAQAQDKVFIIKMAGIRIGKLEAYHIKNSSFDYYVTHSTVDFSVILKIKADIKTESLYHNGILVKAVVNSTLNGIPYSSKTTWEKDHYNIDCHTYRYNYKDSTLTKPIYWTASKLYFEIPAPGDEVFTESYGKMGTLTETGTSNLRMTSPKSKQTYYYNGNRSKLLRIEVINSIKNFDMYPDTLR
ncbi:MAG: hypothetical protein O9353_00950 [Bacteroidia bacterium]|jgi:hypothetical protein|nr:hypothetical protein [Bacteroidia bacterium]